MMRKVLGLLLLLVAVSGTWAQERRDTLVVSRDGTGDFRTLQEAVESARAFMDYTVTIYVKNGVYKEKVIVPSWVENIVLEKLTSVVMFGSQGSTSCGYIGISS